MNYQETLAYLDSLGKFGIRLAEWNVLKDYCGN